MKLELNKKIRQWAVAAACCFWLAGATLPAQEKADDARNAAAAPPAPTAPPDIEAAKPVETVVAEAVSNATAIVETEFEKPRNKGGRHHDAMVIIGSNAELKEGETTEAFIVIGGNGVVKGKVLDAAVVIGGDLDISGEVGDAAVAVMGNLRLRDGANVKGDVVSVGGKLDVADGATVGGHTQAVDFGALGLPHIEWLQKWFVHCVLRLRPLAPQVGWVWIVAGIFVLVYLAVAVVLRKPVEACVAELTRRPATTFFMGLLTKLLLPIVLLILAATVIGLIVVPFVLAALVFGAIVGKVALLEYLGDAIRRATGAAEPLKPAIALLVGALVLTLFYMIPVLGLLMFGVTGLWGLGVAVTAGFGSLKRESPEKPGASPGAAMMAAGPGFLAPMPVAGVAGQVSPGFATGATAAPDASGAMTGSVTPPATTMPEALAHPRATFWERMGAAFLDVVIVGIFFGIVGGPPQGFLVALAYFAGMWAWKGTTVGGVVLGLKVVRLDGRPVTFAVALVRGLAAAFSVIVMFLGFLWIAWDQEKQGWHDRIAGTVVIRLPRGTPLVLL